MCISKGLMQVATWFHGTSDQSSRDSGNKCQLARRLTMPNFIAGSNDVREKHYNFYRATQLCYRGLGSRNSVCPSVRPSVRHTRALWLIQRTYWRCFYTTWKGNPSSFLPANSGWWVTSLSTQNGWWKWPTCLWKSLTSTDNNEFARWHHSAPFWRHLNYISYLLWRWPLLSFLVGFSYIVRIICDGLCTLSKYRFWILIVCWLLRYTKHLHLLAPLVPKSVTSYSIWPFASYLFRWFLRSQPFFTRDAYRTA